MRKNLLVKTLLIGALCGTLYLSGCGSDKEKDSATETVKQTEVQNDKEDNAGESDSDSGVTEFTLTEDGGYIIPGKVIEEKENEYRIYDTGFFEILGGEGNDLSMGMYASQYKFIKNKGADKIVISCANINKMAGYENFSYELYIVGDTKISQDAFRDNDSLTKVYIYSNAGEISNYAFYRCTNLREAVLGSGVEVIDSLSFSECKSLKDISFSEGLKEIKGSAFAGCTSILYVTIPASAKDGVSENVFPNYTEIEYK